LQSRMVGYPLNESIQTFKEISQQNNRFHVANILLSPSLDELGTKPVSSQIFCSSDVSESERSPKRQRNKPKRCLSGNGGTTQAGKSFDKCSRRKTKSWKRLRDWGVVLENIGRLVCVNTLR
jgi:hypothetical protein